jgi:anti-sigma-K factor RskA
MRHLTEQELIDAAEASTAEARRTFLHLDACDRCSRQVLELREMMSAAAGAEIPEPSPLFWNHLSARVREAVSVETVSSAASWRSWRIAAAAAAFTVIVLAAAVALRAPNTPEIGGTTTAGATVAATNASVDNLAGGDDDAALQLIADLSSDLDWETASQAGLMPRAGWGDTVLSELNQSERSALERLVREEIAAL